jgi:hypothetical protein
MLKIDRDGNIFWYNKKEELHREGDLPAVEKNNGYKAWYINGKLHRDNGPAIQYPNGEEYWYKNGFKYISIDKEKVRI